MLSPTPIADNRSMRLPLAAVFILCLIPAIAPAQDTKSVKEPSFPAPCASLNAVAGAGEAQPDTLRIQRALDACSPGKAVRLEASVGHAVFLSGPLQLRKGVTLLVDSGVTLLASRNPRFYDRQPGVCGTITEKGHGCLALINGDGVSDAGVMGDGVIDGQGGEPILGQTGSWWDLAEQARKGGSQNNPRLLILNRCDNFTLYRITLRNSPNFHVSYSAGNGLTVWGVKVWSPQKARNTDGIDPGNSTNVTITRNFIHTGDDQVAIKAGKGAPTTNITVSDNHFYTGHGMSIGSETDGGASRILVTNLSIDGADNGLRIKSNSSRGGLVQDVVYDGVCIRATKNPILMDTNYSYFGEARDKLPEFRDVVVRNTRIEGGGKVSLNGFDGTHRLAIRFDNVVFNDSAAIKSAAKEADISVGPGPFNLVVSGPNVRFDGKSAPTEPKSCVGAFPPFPGESK